LKILELYSIYYRFVRGVGVENLLFAGISLVILIPSLYFLPFGFSLKGKVTILLASTLIALLGLSATAIMPFWQTALIVLLLVGIGSYFLTKKMDELVETNAENVEEMVVEPLTTDAEQLNDTFRFIASSEKEHEEPEVEEDTSLLGKAMRQAGDPKTSVLIGQDKYQLEDHDDEVLLSIKEIAASEKHDTSDEEEEQETEVVYLGEMEDLFDAEEIIEIDEPLDVNLDEDIDEIKINDPVETAQEEQTESLLLEDDLDELPELFFDDEDKLQQDKESNKERESELDSDFWDQLLEDDELEVIEEKKELITAK